MSETPATTRLPDESCTRLSVAPMMERTDRYYRYFARLLAPDMLLYTEMVNANAIVRGDPNRWLEYHDSEHPVALQLGGNEPAKLAAAAKVAEQFGYDEINLNVGCPSDRVRSGAFGACLMGDAPLVADCVAAMSDAVSLPITVKNRIGIDDGEVCNDSYEFLAQFVETVSQGGCEMFIVHARKAVLGGLSPKQNRSIPPIRYEVVAQLAREFPHLRIVVNGAVRDSECVAERLEEVAGVMIGRQAYKEPYWLAELNRQFLNPDYELPERPDVVAAMADYAAEVVQGRVRLHHVTRHMAGLYAGVAGARAWRRKLAALGSVDELAALAATPIERLNG